MRFSRLVADNLIAEIQFIEYSTQITAPQSQNPWIEFAGIFKDDPDFADIARAIRSENMMLRN